MIACASLKGLVKGTGSSSRIINYSEDRSAISKKLNVAFKTISWIADKDEEKQRPKDRSLGHSG